MTMQTVDAHLTWTGQAFERDIQIAIDDAGRIARVGTLGLEPSRTLPHHALLPGFVNAHSHAFQRGLRGRGETFPAGEGTFWSWREAMYGLARGLDADSFYALTLRAFREMRAAGITTVGEFHYFHHTTGARDYALDDLVLRAAAEAKIRLVLLNVYYRSGGIGQPLNDAQRRFETASVDEYWAQMDRLSKSLDPSTQSLGAVAHSIRAVPIDDLIALHEESVRRGLVFHMHVEEQLREIDECIAAYGKPPMKILNERLSIDDRFTAIHCTHTDPTDLKRYLASGGTVCLTPTTEANLGDGIANAAWMRACKGRIALGTDSNVRISMLEEMRWLEYAQRLAAETRGVFRDAEGSVGRALLEIATAGGARSLDVDAGHIAPGAWADLVAIDLESPALDGWTAESLLDSLTFGCSDAVIAASAVGGEWIEHR